MDTASASPDSARAFSRGRAAWLVFPVAQSIFARDGSDLSQGLFRQEVVDAKRGEWLGSIIVAAPLSRWLLTMLALTLAVVILLFLFFGHYTRRETVLGQLVPSAGLLNIAAPGAGTISPCRCAMAKPSRPAMRC
jgi:hypothetical protein